MCKAVLLVLLWGLCSPLKGQLPALIPFNDHGKWGYADSNGNIRIKPQWKAVSFFCPNGLAWVERDEAIRYRGRKRDTEVCRGIIDTNGAYIIPPYYTLSEITPEYNYLWLEFGESGYSLFNLQGKLICRNCLYGDSLYIVLQEAFYVINKGYGLRDLDGKIKTRARFRYFYPPNEESGQQNSYINYCKVIIENDSSMAELINKDYPLWKARRRKKYFLLDSNGKVVIRWKSHSEKRYVEEYNITRLKGTYFEGIKKLYPLQFPDSTLLSFTGSTVTYSCKEFYRLLSENSGTHSKALHLLSSPDFYLTDRHGRKYVKM